MAMLQRHRHPSLHHRGRPLRARLTVAAAAAPPADRGAVVVSGASSGIGKASALLLAQAGFRTFAGVRDADAAAELRAMHPLIEPLTLDVAATASVRAAAAVVADAVGSNGLQGLVNNSGFGVFLPVETFPEEAWESVMNVNVTGVLRCTQAFLPLLRAGEQRGRIVNMSSIAGSVSFPLFSAYAGSKHALEAMSDALRYELMPQGIPVSIIKPGPVKTAIWSRARKGSMQYDLPPEAADLYGTMVEKTLELTRDGDEKGIEAEEVARLVVKALTAKTPRSRYVVGTTAPAIQVLRRLLPDSLFNPLIAKYYGL